ncbi:MAG: Polyhydroxyalkanoic acid synthase [Labilithrix sp.]|nr:Polyhydroxyalkanoic acid synthase [Labilithrix sp.]
MFEARIAPTPKDTVLRDGRGSVYRFRGSARAGSHVPVLLVPSMINRWYVLDLREGASLATALSAGAPWDTFCFDWGIPEDEDRYLGWDDVVGRLDRVVRRVLRITGAPKLAILGYSIGATLSGIYTALHPERIAALVNLAGPFDFTEAGRLGTMADARWFDPAAMTAAGNFSATQMQSGLMAVSPTHWISKWVDLADEIHDPSARAAFSALEAWGCDGIPFPAAAYVTYIKELYQENRLVRGEHFVHGARVDLSRITCPVLSVVAERDAICPPKAATALNDHTSSRVKDVLSVHGGHVGAVVGSRAATELYPQLKTWLERHGPVPNARVPESRL